MKNKKALWLWVFLMAGLFGVNAKAIVVSLGQVVYNTAVIASGTTTTGTITTNGMSLVGCQLPSAFTGTQLSFYAATTTSGPWQALENSSGQVKYTVSPGIFMAINAADFYGVQYFKIASNSAEGAQRSLVCGMKGL